MYAKQADCMLIIAPKSRHANMDVLADKESYKSRVWTRAEQFAHFCQHGMENIYLVEYTEKLQPVNDEWMNSVCYVFEGEMTCCRKAHNSGATPCDRESLVLPLLGLYSELFHKACLGTTSKLEQDALLFIDADKNRMFPADYSYCTGEGKAECRTLFGDLIA